MLASSRSGKSTLDQDNVHRLSLEIDVECFRVAMRTVPNSEV